MIWRNRNRVATFYPHASKHLTDPLARLAVGQTKAALRTGNLKKQPCATCGAKRKVEAHHEDYSRPLEVVWLCRYHHRLLHAEKRQKERHKKKQQVKQPRPFAAQPYRERINRQLLHGASASLIRQATLQVIELMESENVNEATLARRIGCSRQALNNSIGAGFRTLKRVAVAADALGYEVHLSLCKRPEELAS